MTGDREFVRDRLAGVLQTLATRFVDNLFDRFGDNFRLDFLFTALFGGRVERLRLLRTVAVNRDRFETQFPAPEVRVGDVLRRDIRRHVDRLGDRTGQKWLGGRHHRDVSLPRDAADAAGRFERTIKHRQMIDIESRGTLDRVVGVDVSQNGVDLLRCITEFVQTQTHGLVDDFQHPAAGELFVLHQCDVRLDAGGIAVHHERDRAGWC